MDGGQLSASHVSFIECRATVAGDSYGNARGGAVFVGLSSRAYFNDVTFRSCHASNAQQGALAAGGAMYVDGYASVDNSLFDVCTAEGARASDGFGGALFVTSRGSALLSNGTSFVGNQVVGTLEAASHGNSVLSEGRTVYLLPAPAGHFIFGQRCYVQRAACTRDGKGFYDDQACVDTTLNCSLQIETDAKVCQSSGIRDGINVDVHATDEAGSGEAHCTSCQDILDNQQCPWRELPELVGGFVQNLPQSVDGTFPQACAPGVLGSTEPQYQMAAICSGKCRSGTFQDKEGQTECKACLSGSFCALGAAAALPCPEGTYSSATNLTSADECTTTDPGFFAPTGSIEQTACAAGTVSASGGLGSCVPCGAGFYQDAEGKTTCKPCSRGFYCPRGSSAAMPCPAGTSSNQTHRASSDACQPVTRGFWAPLGSAEPTPCPESGFYCPGAGEDDVNDPPGSKPIIVPVGGATERVQVAVVEQQVTLGSIQLASINYTAMRMELAVLYGVSPDLLSLHATAVTHKSESGNHNDAVDHKRRQLLHAGVQLGIKVSGPSGSGDVAASLDALMATVNAVDIEVYMQTTLNVTVSAAPPQSQLTTHDVTAKCATGHW